MLLRIPLRGYEREQLVICFIVSFLNFFRSGNLDGSCLVVPKQRPIQRGFLTSSETLSCGFSIMESDDASEILYIV